MASLRHVLYVELMCYLVLEHCYAMLRKLDVSFAEQLLCLVADLSSQKDMHCAQLSAVQMAVRPASVSTRACAPAAVTVAIEKGCAASCKAMAKAGE